MKILKKIVVVLILLVVALYIFVYLGKHYLFKEPYSTEPTIEVLGNGNFTFGAASRKQPKNMDEYVDVLSSQVKYFNKNFVTFWPNNPAINQYLIAKSSKEKGAYLIDPNGNIKKLSENEFSEYNFSSMNIAGQWQQFSHDGKSGAYVNVIPEELTNYYSFQKYEHLGTYDQFLSYSHELFHSITQNTWDDANLADNNREERMDDSTARRTRMLLTQQLAEAISDPDNRDTLTKDAIATYKYYREVSKDDYEYSVLYDRLEGTAYYYELISSLYAGYPSEIKNKDDCFNALEIILANDNPAYRNTGLSSESYNIGGYSGILLDMIAEENNSDPNEWKKEIEKNGQLNPMILLENQVGEDIPNPKEIPSESEYNEWIKGAHAVSPISSKMTNIVGLMYAILY